MQNSNCKNISFHLDLLPDEMLVSWVIRYHLLSANKEISTSLLELFGSSRKALVFGNLLKREPSEWLHFSSLLGISYDKFLTDFSSYYYESAFNSSYGVGSMTQFGASKILPDIVNHFWERKRQKKLYIKDGVALRLCPQCVVRDIQNHGTPYWHKCHQLDSVQVCHLHDIWLATSCPSCGKAYCSNNEIKLPSLDCDCCNMVNPHSHTNDLIKLEAAARFARISAGPIRMRTFPFSPIILGKFYKSIVENHVHKPTTSIGLVASDLVIQKFGFTLINTICSKLQTKDTISSWINHLIAGRHQPPNRHLILITTFFESFEEFKFQYDEFSQNDVNSLTNLDDQSKYSLKLQKLTKQKARESFNEIKSQNSALTRTKLSKLDQRLYRYLTTNDREWFIKQLPSKTIRRDGSRAEPGRISSVETDRSRLLKILAESQVLSASILSKKYTKLYRRMLLRDSAWLKSIFDTKRPKISDKQINDKRRASAIPVIAENIRSRPGRPIKVTILELMKVLKEPRENLVGKGVPLSKDVTNRVIDTPESYYSRLCDWAIRELVLEGEKIQISNIVRKIRISTSKESLKSICKSKIAQFNGDIDL